MIRLAARRGFTLFELLIVLMILSLILTAAVKTWDVTLERGRFESTRKKLGQLATSITGEPDYIVAGSRADFGYVGDMGALPRTLAELVVRPDYADSTTWRGPYLRAAFSESPETYRIDGWGDTLIYNTDSMFLRSYGGRGLSDRTRWMTQNFGYTRGQLLANSVSGRVLDAMGATPPASLFGTGKYDLFVTLFYPREGRRDSWTISGATLVSGFEFRDMVPQGTHRLRVLFRRFVPPGLPPLSSDMNVTVYPGIGARDVTLRLSTFAWQDTI